jgi:UDP-N-acetylglucosamine/UDP-N-acetylgalactosamine diphosphorylase
VATPSLETLTSQLKPYGQTHVLQFWEELEPSQQAELAAQIEGFDLQQLQALYQSKDTQSHWGELAAKSTVPPAITLADFADEASFEAAYQTGAQLIGDGKVGMIIVAGGQGSRLGFDHPKGMYPIGPISGNSLFQIFIEKVIARAKQFGSTIPLYIMTSPPTHQETIEYLTKENFFGFNPDDVMIFCQGVMPAVDEDGKLLLQEKGKIFVSPDGHGGALLALEKSGAIADMKKRGVEHNFYGQIDNPLVQVCDPALLGYHAKSGSEMTSQVVRKTHPTQKVGNVVTADGQVQVIEYSDLPEEHAKQTNEDGSLRLWAGSIAVHIFKTEFFDRMAQTAGSLPFHRAHKKVAFVDADGAPHKPQQNNAVKFEKFIFDLLPSAKNAIICEVDPADGFNAVKNAPPADAETPDHVKAAISDLHTRWFKECGVDVADDATIEISPLFAPDAKALKAKIQADPSLAKTITNNTFFQ